MTPTNARMSSSIEALMKMHYRSVLVGISITLIYSCGVGEEDKLNSALHLYKKKEFTQALIELQKLEVSQQKRLLEGKIHLELSNYSEAVSTLSRVVVDGPVEDTVNYLLGKAYAHMGWDADRQGENPDEFREKSLKHFGFAINGNPEFFMAYDYKTNVLHNLERHQENLAFLEKAAQIFPDSSDLRLYAAMAKVSLADFKSAEIDITNYIDNCSKTDSINLALAFRFRGRAFSGMKEYDSAIQAYSESLRYDKSELTFMNRAFCYLRIGERMKACEDLRSSANAGYFEAYGQIRKECTAYGY